MFGPDVTTNAERLDQSRAGLGSPLVPSGYTGAPLAAYLRWEFRCVDADSAELGAASRRDGGASGALVVLALPRAVQPPLHRPDRDLGPGAQPEAGEDLRSVVGRGPRRDAQP